MPPASVAHRLPPGRIRPLAVGIVRRGDELLLMAVRDAGGALKGWRPLGGAIEFGERAAAALRREFHEETGQPVAEPRLLAVIESLFEHNGASGHEIVFVFETAFADEAAYARDRFVFVDAGAPNDAEWVGLARLRSGNEPLFPDGLLALLDAA